MNIQSAADLIKSEFEQFTLTISQNERVWFFDGRNRDQWMDAFIEHLRKRYQKPDRIASND